MQTSAPHVERTTVRPSARALARAPAHPAPPRAPREHTREPCTPARAPPLMFDGPDRTSITNPAHLAPSHATAHAPRMPIRAPCTSTCPAHPARPNPLARASPHIRAQRRENDRPANRSRPHERASRTSCALHAPSAPRAHSARIPNRAAASDAPPRTPSAHLEHGRRDRAVSQTTEASLYSSRVRTARRSRHAQSSRAPHTKQDQPRKTPRNTRPQAT